MFDLLLKQSYILCSNRSTSLFLSDYQLVANKYLSCRWQTRATRCITTNGKTF